jgi:hypothetical protein
VLIDPEEQSRLEIRMTNPLPASELHIFPTLHREKHSHLVSYPMGAEALSRVLDGLPQHQMLACNFFAGNTHQHLDKPRQLVLSASYHRRERSFNDGQNAEARGVFLPRWSITVFAVPRPLRNAIKTALLSDGLPNILRPWLAENAGLTGKVGGCAINLEYDVAADTLVATARKSIQPDRA